MASDLDETHQPEEEEESRASRRNFLGYTVLLGAAAAGTVGYPLLRLAAAPLGRAAKADDWHDIGPLEDFAAAGEGRVDATYEFQAQDGWYTATHVRRVLVGKEKEAWVVFSSECTHLGCGVEWKPDSREFYCPCHGGVFAADGSVVKGPPQRPLVRLEAREREGRLEVREA